MRWRKLGIVYSPKGDQPWARTHAMLPTPLYLPQLQRLRVFYTACDERGVGRPGFVDLDPNDPTRVLGASDRPLMDVGKPGTFDDNGAVATSVVALPDGRLMMYYVGFELAVNVRYRLLTGVAISDDFGETFTRYSETPVLERSTQELYFRCGPFVVYEDGRFRMWYVAGSHWIDLDGKAMPEYRMMYQESADGVTWAPAGQLVLDITEPDEHGFGRPWILRDGDSYRLLYSIRRKSLASYRMGYATSADGLRWSRRDDHLNLDVGPDAYDNAAIMYAAPIVLDGRTYCFYNGNDFGREGFAVALLEKPDAD
jgi:hypothetical protein